MTATIKEIDTVPLLNENADGVYIIAATPFTDHGAIDFASIDRLVEFYIACGVSGITVLGMMGEAPKLTAAESVEFLRHFLGRTADRVPVVIGVSGAGFDNLKGLALSAMDAGAAGVMIAPQATKTETQTISYFAQICETLGQDVPVCFQDYPFSTGAYISAENLSRMFEAMPQIVVLKHEDWPGLNKISQVRKLAVDRKARRVSILVGNGGLFLPQELARGADGAMTGFAYPEMLVEVVARFKAGDADGAEDIYDAYLPLVRYEQQPGIGLAIRKEILRRRGVISSAAVRSPGPRLNDLDMAELTRLIGRLEARLSQME